MDGKKGEDGREAGNIYLYIKEEIRNYRLTLIANGGNGSKGIDGENGETGASGSNGADAGYTSYFHGQMFKGYFEKGTSGKKGEKGGAGGNAGRGGNAGKKGNIYFISDSEEQKNRIINHCDITVKDGEAGPNGRPGLGGYGGSGGYHGYNTLSFSPSGIDKTVYYTGYFTSWDYKLDSIIKYHIEFSGGSWNEGKTGPAREYAEYGDRGDNGGHVFPASITYGTQGVAAPRDDNKILVYSTNFDDIGVISFTLDELEYDKKANWANYVKGMVLKLKEAGHSIDHGFELLVEGTIPNGAGLSSSASLELLVGVVLEDLFDLKTDRLELVQTGKKVENEFIGVNSGIMDQFAIGFGELDHAILLDTNTLKCEMHTEGPGIWREN